MSIAIFIPTRKGSERVINKNTRPFCNFKGGLLELKLKQVLSSKNVSKVILSTNDEESIRIAEGFLSLDKRLVIDLRPDYLCQSSTSLIDLVNYVSQVVKEDHILWTHVTSPFVDGVDYDAIIQSYLQNNIYDSLMTVKRIQNFIWDKDSNDIMNRVNQEKWPRTQDLKTLYEIDSAVFLTSKNNYLEFRDRIGQKPYLYVQEGFKSMDVDWEEDFQLTELIYNSLNKYGNEKY